MDLVDLNTPNYHLVSTTNRRDPYGSRGSK